MSDKVVKHLRDREDFRTVGYHPTNASGVTISTGVDLGQFSARELNNLGVSKSVMNKYEPYLGLETKSDVTQANLKAENLVLTVVEAEESERLFVNKHKIEVEPFCDNMGEYGQAVLVSLRHWAGSLGNTKGQGKLSIFDGQKNVNYVWDAIKHNNATLPELKTALEKTVKLHRDKTAAKNRINYEIAYINNHSN